MNGFFAAAEIAVVASRRIQIKQLIEEGNKNAEILKFKEEPDRFLATIQIAITLGSVLAAAIGGATAVQIIKPAILTIPVKAIAASSEAISIGIVTIVITFFFASLRRAYSEINRAVKSDSGRSQNCTDLLKCFRRTRPLRKDPDVQHEFIAQAVREKNLYG